MKPLPGSLGRGPHDREIAALAIPALGALAADPLLSLVDTAFVGRLGAASLGALGVAVAAFAVVFQAFTFLEYGTTSRVARAVGAGNAGGAARATATALGIALASGAAAALALAALAGPIVGVMGASAEVRGGATAYLRIRALALPGVLVVRAAAGAYRGYQDTRTPFLVVAGLNVVNLVLDPVLIFGLDMGIAGAAWATVGAQWLGAAAFLALLLGRDREKWGIRLTGGDAGEVGAFLRAAGQLALRSGALLAVFTMATAVAARVADAAVAAHQVIFQVWLFLALALDALAIAAQALVGRLLGSGDRSAARAVADRLLMVGATVGFGFAGLLAVASPWLPGWFSDDPDVIGAMRSVYWWGALMQPPAALVFVWDGVFLGAGDFAYLAAATGAAAAAAGALLALVLPLGWGLPGVWWGIAVLVGVRAVTLAWRRLSPRSPLGP